MRRLPLVAALASLLILTTQTTAAADLGLQAQARQALEAKLAVADPQGQVYADHVFSNKAAVGLPAGWRTASWNKGTVSIDANTGNLLINGKADSTAMTAVLLPQSLESLSNYRVDMEFSFEQPNNTARWGSVMYRSSAATNTPAHEPYYQFAIRQAATANNGTEFAYRNAGAWSVQATKPFSEAIDQTKTYTASVVVHGNRVRQYLNGALQHDTILSAELAKGGIGMQTAGLIMRVKSIKVTEQITPLPDLDMPVAVQDTGTPAAMAPTLVQAAEGLPSVEGTGASNALWTLDSALNLRDASGAAVGTLQAYYAQAKRNTIPLLRIQDEATLNALLSFSDQVHNLADLTLMSSDVTLLKQARVALPKLRTAVDFSERKLTTSPADLLTIVGDTNRAGAKIAILPESLTSRALVSHLQRLLITVWSNAEATTPEQAAQVLVSGVNGVVSRNSAAYADVLRKLPANTLLRKPLVIGHRGMPSREDENTLESARAAVAAGADAVENDIYITTDDHLVIMHDDTVNRTTSGTGNVEGMTLAQVKALTTKTKGYQVPTMREYFKAFKNDPITHVIELKSSNPRIIAQLKKEMAEEGVADQSVAISFMADQLKRSGEQMPELTGGFLNSIADSADVPASVRNVLEATQANSSTFNPSFAAIRQSTMEAAKHRGVSFWPWTVNDAATFYKYYSWGTNGITTDHAYLASNFPVEIAAKPQTAALALNEPLSLGLNLTTQIRTQTEAVANELVYLGGTATAVRNGNGALSFSSAGTAIVMPGYRHQMDGTYSYVIMGKPVTLVVGDGSDGVVGTPNAPAAGNVACSSAVPGQTSTCTVLPQPGYQLVGLSVDSTCPAGQWNADNTAYTTGTIAAQCQLRFDFAAKPASASLTPIGKEGEMQATVRGGGTGLWAFDAAQAVAVSPAAAPPKGVSFPFGVVSLQLNGGQPGQSATVEMTYPQALPANAKYYKYGKTTDNKQDHWYAYPNATISGNKVVLTLTDGQTGDDDLLANGVIRDPGGVALLADDPGSPGTPGATATPVPTLGHAALALLSGGMGLLAWRRKRKALV
ncbi:glycerophosphoryl diester phosphodiesterase [Comamonas sp. BIGb0152]|uniref:IPTL-CTERM sorting domain-containing protein n=1 Tax=Comamonas sp. BIGb0152 TaxID=2940601 RepID=UPI0021675789|nr:IPTL-CTERM sorting domain-containing protein [Comamonas sp. BIGb0152]MCS4295738.1 glycerophosphoryl diester phosphodiesterase [Comamonas sp. BIGb0152]